MNTHVVLLYVLPMSCEFPWVLQFPEINIRKYYLVGVSLSVFLDLCFSYARCTQGVSCLQSNISVDVSLCWTLYILVSVCIPCHLWVIIKYNSHSRLHMAASFHFAYSPRNQPAPLCWNITAPRLTGCKLLCRNLIKHKVIWVGACNHVSTI